MSTSKMVTAVVIGAGSRGFGYACYATECPDKFKACFHAYVNFELSLDKWEKRVLYEGISG
jgi:hypothetical protein